MNVIQYLILKKLDRQPARQRPLLHFCRAFTTKGDMLASGARRTGSSHAAHPGWHIQLCHCQKVHCVSAASGAWRGYQETPELEGTARGETGAATPDPTNNLPGTCGRWRQGLIPCFLQHSSILICLRFWRGMYKDPSDALIRTLTWFTPLSHMMGRHEKILRLDEPATTVCDSECDSDEVVIWVSTDHCSILVGSQETVVLAELSTMKDLIKGDLGRVACVSSVDKNKSWPCL